MSELISGKFATQHNGLQIFFDAYLPSISNNGIVIFLHGFKGFKNWGAWHQMGKYFNEEGWALVLFDFSLNGISNEGDSDISNLENFRKNTIGSELKDLHELIEHLSNIKSLQKANFQNLCLVGHSRGGATALLYAAAHPKQINKVITWAGVSDLKRMYAAWDKKSWEKDGFISLKNQRTGAILPLNYTCYQDLEKPGRDVLQAAAALECEFLIIHGNKDEAVPMSDAEALYDACQHAVFIVVENAGHTFNTAHPWEADKMLPPVFLHVIKETISFL